MFQIINACVTGLTIYIFILHCTELILINCMMYDICCVVFEIIRIILSVASWFVTVVADDSSTWLLEEANI